MPTSYSNSPWQEDESLHPILPILESSPHLRAISFDFFDTLVSRLCAEPPDLFLEVGRRLAHAKLLRAPLNPREFQAARVAADERARDLATDQGHATEIQLALIYRELSAVVSDVDAALRVEIDTERAFCFVNPSLANLVQHLHRSGRRCIIISDTYFRRRQLEQFLRDGNLDPSLFAAIYTSCETGRSKWKGDLFSHVLQEEKIHPGEILHIGDNPHADIQVATNHGIQTIHYYRTTPHLEAVFHGESARIAHQTPAAANLQSLRTLALRRFADPQDPARDGAFTFGPILSRFADWCVQRFHAAGVTTVLALMREGEVLGSLVERAAHHAGIDLEIVPCFVSRLSTARAALPEVTPRQVAELLEGTPSLTPQAVFDILGIGNEATHFLDQATRQQPLSGAQSIAGLLQLLFRLPQLRERIQKFHAESHALAFDYLSNLAGSHSCLGVLDLGWSGSIQRNIARILRHGGRRVRTVGCYLASTRRSGRLALEGDVAHAYFPTDWSGSTILAEVAITSPIGSTNTYARDPSGSVVPVLAPNPTSPTERLLKQRIRHGIDAFQSLWLGFLRSRPGSVLSTEMLADLDQRSPAILSRLLDFPTKPEADRLGNLQHDENYFGSNFSAPLCDPQASDTLLKEGVLGLFRDSRSYWPPGVVARTRPRLISALRSTWQEPSFLGDLGACTPPGPNADPGWLSFEETHSLIALLQFLLPAHILLSRPLPTVALQPLLDSWPHSTQKPHLLHLHPSPSSPPPTTPSVTRHPLADSPDFHQTLQAIRSLLNPLHSSTLVLDPDLAPQAVQTWIHSLAPFLGPQGSLLLPCGRFDRLTFGSDSPLAPILESWMHHTGADLGYSTFLPPGPLRAHLRNWIILRRCPDSHTWNGQWTFRLSDLAGSQRLPALLASSTH